MPEWTTNPLEGLGRSPQSMAGNRNQQSKTIIPKKIALIKMDYKCNRFDKENNNNCHLFSVTPCQQNGNSNGPLHLLCIHHGGPADDRFPGGCYFDCKTVIEMGHYICYPFTLGGRC